MSDLLPEALQAMLKHAEETYAAGDIENAEIEYLLAVEYSNKIYHSLSPETGLVLMKLLNFYNDSRQQAKAAILTGRVNAILYFQEKESH